MKPPVLFSSMALPARPQLQSLVPALERFAVQPLHLGHLHRRAHQFVRRTVLLLALSIFAVVIALLAVRVSASGAIYPGVNVAGNNLGGLSSEEARAVLQGQADHLESGTIRFNYGGTTWSPTLRALGASFNVAGAVDQAYGVGREPTALERLRATAGLAHADKQIQLGMTFDHAVLAKWFDTVDRDLGLPPHDAYLQVNGSSVSIVPEVDGTIVDRSAATTTILRSLDRLTPIDEPLPVVAKVAVVRSGDLAGSQQRLAAALSKPIRLSYGQGSWTLQASDLAPFIVQRVDPAKAGADAHSMSLDTDKLTSWLANRIAPDVDRDPVSAQVGWNEGLVATTASVEGVRLRPADLAAAVQKSLFGDHQPIVLPVDVIEPEIDSSNLGALGVTTLLGRGDSNYAGSIDGRATNIEVGTALLNGTLVPPGGEFSFNHAIGVISEDQGFVEAQVIDGERIGRDIGGGICQVSTTAFRAAFMAGLPITERNPHRYRIPFYEADGWPPGLDASILQPEGDPFGGGDFRFANPSNSWMLVEAWTTGEQVVVNIYGADLGYTVKVSDPIFGKTIPIDPDLETVNDELDPGSWKQTEHAQEGIEVNFVRDVDDRDGNLIESQEFYTLFWSRGNVYQVSPDMLCKSPAGSCSGDEE